MIARLRGGSQRTLYKGPTPLERMTRHEPQEIVVLSIDMSNRNRKYAQKLYRASSISREHELD